MIVELYRAGLTKDGQSAKTEELYAYLAGSEFRQTFDVLVDSAKELGDLLHKECTAHERTWAKRQQVYNELTHKPAAMDGRLRATMERSDERRAKVVRLRKVAS